MLHGPFVPFCTKTVKTKLPGCFVTVLGYGSKIQSQYFSHPYHKFSGGCWRCSNSKLSWAGSTDLKKRTVQRRPCHAFVTAEFFWSAGTPCVGQRLCAINRWAITEKNDVHAIRMQGGLDLLAFLQQLIQQILRPQKKNHTVLFQAGLDLLTRFPAIATIRFCRNNCVFW